METFILVVYILTNNPFHELDAVPTVEFTSEQKCKDFVSNLQKTKKLKHNSCALRSKIIDSQ